MTSRQNLEAEVDAHVRGILNAISAMSDVLMSARDKDVSAKLITAMYKHKDVPLYYKGNTVMAPHVALDKLFEWKDVELLVGDAVLPEGFPEEVSAEGGSTVPLPTSEGLTLYMKEVLREAYAKLKMWQEMPLGVLVGRDTVIVTEVHSQEDLDALREEGLGNLPDTISEGNSGYVYTIEKGTGNDGPGMKKTKLEAPLGRKAGEA